MKFRDLSREEQEPSSTTGAEGDIGPLCQDRANFDIYYKMMFKSFTI